MAAIERIVFGVGRVLSLVLITRCFGVAALGLTAYLFSVWAIATAVGLLGLEIANNYYGARADTLATRSLLGNTVLFSLASGAMLGLCMAIVAAQTNLLDVLPGGWIRLVQLGIAVNILGFSIGGLLFGRNLLLDRCIGTGVHQLSYIAGLCLLVVTGNLDTAFIGWTWLGAQVIGIGYWCFALLREVGWRAALSTELMRMQLSFGVGAYTYNMLNTLNYRFDAYIIGMLVGPVGLGLYSVAATVSESLLYIPKTFLNVVLRHSRSTGKIDSRVFGLTAMILVLGAAVVGGGAALFVPFVFGAEFTEAVVPLQILLVATCFLGIALVGVGYLFGLGNSRTPTAATLVSVVVTVTLDVVLIPNQGLVGAAVASGVGYTVFAGVIYAGLRKHQSVHDSGSGQHPVTVAEPSSI